MFAKSKSELGWNSAKEFQFLRSTTRDEGMSQGVPPCSRDIADQEMIYGLRTFTHSIPNLDHPGE
jgi:hypothetical protein